MKVITNYDGCGYITAGKVYDAELLEGCDNLVTLVDDDGSEIITRIGYTSLHLNELGVFRVVTEEEEEVMSNEFQGFEVGQQFRILDSVYTPDFEIGEIVTVKSVTKSSFSKEIVGDIGKNRRIGLVHLDRCVEYLGMTPEHVFEVGQQFIVNDPEEMGVCGEYSVGDVMTVVGFEMNGSALDQYNYGYPSGWVSKGYLTLTEAPEVHPEDATGRFWCDSTDRSYDTLEEALIDQAFYDWAELCIEFREDQRETGALLLDYIPDSVKREVALKALRITDGGEV